jgi:4-amino-4-deoxy-L-arabinose transferase-like glycosyltransferase
MSVPAVHSLMRRRGFRFTLIGLLLVLMFSLAVDSLRWESVTLDEPLHLTAGYAFCAFGDYRLQESHGALPQRWFALPLLVTDVKFPSREDDSWHHPGYLGLQACFKFFFDSSNNPDAMVFHGRLMAVVMALLAALAVYGWTARVFGPAAGLLACFLCALDPTMLAHGRLMTSDVTAAVFFLMSIGCFWSLLRRFTWFRLASSIVCFGLLMVSKMSGLLAVPMVLLIFLSRVALGRPWPVRLSGFRPRQICALPGKACLGAAAALAHIVGALAIIWCFYGWQFVPSPDWNEDRDSYTESRDSVFEALDSSRPMFIAAERWKILPEAYLYGLAHTIKHSEQRPAYLNGEYSTTGWWYYFPYCFLAKTPLTLLALIGLGAGSLVYRVVRHGGRRQAALWALLDRTSLIWSLLLVYGVAAFFTNLNIGHRHLLPIYPPLFMLAGAAGWWFMRGRRWSRAAIVVLLMLQMVVIVRIHPHYLAYFNELAGGPGKGYLHLTDSNLDWGQDLPSFARWLSEHRKLAKEGKLYFNYFGFDLPQRWGIQARTLPGISNPQLSSADPLTCQAGIYAFSATALIDPGRGRPPWDEGRELEYRDLLSQFRELEQTSPFHKNDAESVRMWKSFIMTFADRQYCRLRGYLMGRKPDAMIGYSILIFHLSDTELRAALLP